MNNNSPPRWPAAWLQWFCAPELYEELQGDLDELFQDRLTRMRRNRASVLYALDVLFCFRAHTLRRRSTYPLARGPVMWKNYLKISWRNVRRQKGYAFINIVGLTVGLTCCLLIVLFVQDEYAYDRAHPASERIYRITQTEVAVTAPTVGPTLVQDFAGVEESARILATPGEVLIKREDQIRHYEGAFFWADSTVFDLFAFPLVRGNPETALHAPNRIVITEAMAQKYFGMEDPMGQILTFDVGMTADLEVTGILKSDGPASHFQPDFLASMATFEAFGFFPFDNWQANAFHTYLKLDNARTAEALAAQLPTFFERHTGEASNRYQLQPVTDIHLYSHLQAELQANGDVSRIYLVSVIGLLLLFIASVNYMNLATARSMRRATEVGVRKVLGAYRTDLIRQFLSESLLITALAWVLSFGLAWFALPWFNTLAGKHMDAAFLGSGSVLLLVLVILAATGLVAGSYPAFFLSKFRPVHVLKGRIQSGGSGAWFRKGLVVAQFGIGIVMIIGTLLVSKQLNYMQQKQLGFDAGQTLVVPVRTHGHGDRPPDFESIKAELFKHPSIVQAAASGEVPGRRVNRFLYRLEGETDETGVENRAWSTYRVDPDYLETLRIELVAGRDFSDEFLSDSLGAWVINEAAVATAVEQRGPEWAEPVGKQIDAYTQTQNGLDRVASGRVIGVVRDFHFESLHSRIEPLVLQVDPHAYDNLLINVRSGDLPETLAYIEHVWTAMVPNRPFESFFLDDAFDELYQSERQLAEVLRLFAFLAVLISCLGLFGLASYMAEQRTKEIGIRKVMGASSSLIMMLLSKDYLRLVGLAFVIAMPVAYLLVDQWLSGFAYRTLMGVGPFVTAGILALGIVLLSVGYQSIKAALANPVEALRYE